MKKPAPADPQTCADCKFHKPNETDEFGFCLRYPPVPHLDTEDGAQVMLWPILAKSEWCGEFCQRTH